LIWLNSQGNANVKADSPAALTILWGLHQQNTVFATGKSILNRTSSVDIGELMLRYGKLMHINKGQSPHVEHNHCLCGLAQPEYELSRREAVMSSREVR
jgi:hypothetical protein